MNGVSKKELLKNSITIWNYLLFYPMDLILLLLFNFNLSKYSFYSFNPSQLPARIGARKIKVGGLIMNPTLIAKGKVSDNGVPARL